MSKAVTFDAITTSIAQDGTEETFFTHKGKRVDGGAFEVVRVSDNEYLLNWTPSGKKSYSICGVPVSKEEYLAAGGVITSDPNSYI